MNYLTEFDIRERLDDLIKRSNDIDTTNIQLLVMVYIQMAYTFGDIDADTKLKLLNEYLLMLSKMVK